MFPWCCGHLRRRENRKWYGSKKITMVQMHPYVISQLAAENRASKVARAERQRKVQQARAAHRATAQDESTGLLSRPLRVVTRARFRIAA
jgi:hypothetical protein